MSISKKLFGRLPCGSDVYAYVLKNGTRTSVQILNYGGIISNLWVADANGVTEDVVCGFDCIEGYLTSGGYQGALIGRIGNRIAGGKFVLEGKEYTLFRNDGNNSLHGGQYGFNTKIWDVAETDGEEPSLALTYTSPDGEEGYPGTLSVKVTYTLTRDAGISIHYEAETDKTTIVNLTNHAYFNMAGYDKSTIDNQLLWLNSDKVNSFNDEYIPDGTLIEVAGTAYDFTKEKAVGADFGDSHPMMQSYGGYDNNFFFADYNGTLKHQATLRDTASGRTMKMYTDLPCVQVYTANMINVDDHPFKGDVKQYTHCGICLETQAMPNSINMPGFTNVILKKGEKYDTTTVYLFE
ncbi:MAG: galactose mutarotase [Clostridia bacterium]|nr:galactose mutarotase [Clostridia bacterium]